MQHLLSALILSVSSNLDTVTVCISYGMYDIRLPWLSNILIAFITSVGTFLSMEFGHILSVVLPGGLGNVLGGITLILLGLWFLLGCFKNTMKTSTIKPEEIPNNETLMADKDASGDINLKETIPLSLALTINNIGVGIAASMTGVSILYSTILTFIITILSVCGGTWLGRSILGKICGKCAPLLSSILLIIIGVYETII